MTDAFEIPVFPLPETVLFSQTVLPLHVFEPRYRRMMADTLDTRGWIGMALLKPGWEPDYQGRPPFHEIIGVGEILHHEKTSDGRYGLTLRGIGRASVKCILDDREYRRAECEFSPETCSWDEAKKTAMVAALEKTMGDVVRRFVLKVPMLNPQQLELADRLQGVLHALCNIVVPSPAIRQLMLELPSLDERLDSLLRKYDMPEVSALVESWR